MDKRVVYVAFWNTELQNLINFLKEKQYNQDEVDRLEFLVKEHTLESTGMV